MSEPSREPAKTIYRAFQDEASKRKGRTVADWTAAEVNRVYLAAVDESRSLGLRTPTLEEVVAAEQCARGHIDYGAKWAHGVVARMSAP
jgi:hypothetical protein